jgi:hypothetical protein
MQKFRKNVNEKKKLNKPLVIEVNDLNLTMALNLWMLQLMAHNNKKEATHITFEFY